MDLPTREQMRQDLARAMDYSVEVRWTHATDPNWKIYDVRLPGGTYAGSHSADEPNIVRECLLVKTAVVAEAAWRAI